MKLAQAGIAALEESKTWSIPKIQLWISLLEQEQISAALLLSRGVWEPKKLAELIGALDIRLMTFTGEKPEPAEEWEPPSLTRVLKHMRLVNRKS